MVLICEVVIQKLGFHFHFILTISTECSAYTVKPSEKTYKPTTGHLAKAGVPVIGAVPQPAVSAAEDMQRMQGKQVFSSWMSRTGNDSQQLASLTTCRSPNMPVG